jgi:streptogramin lyase
MNTISKIISCKSKKSVAKLVGMMMFSLGLISALCVVSQPTFAFTANIQEYSIPTPDSGPTDIVVDPSGNVWFTERNGNKIGKLSLAGIFTEYPVTFSQPIGIAYNLYTGSVYFTGGNYGDGHYGVLSPNSRRVPLVVEFPTGLPVASATTCTLTPDGKFWFNGWDSSSVSRANASGIIDNYSLPSFGYTSGLSEDAQGNLWLTQVSAFEYNPKLIKFDTKLAQPGTSNGFTEIPLPYSQAQARGPIAALGKIWLTLGDQSKILSYDPEAGTFAEYATPTPNAAPSGLALDRWNRLWFTEVLANKIGMLDLRTGIITEFAIPTPNSHPENLAVDVDRNIVYFTESAGNKIGKLTLRP